MWSIRTTRPVLSVGTTAMGTSCWRVTRFIVLLLLALFELALVCFLAWMGHLYLEYLTYMTKLVFMLVLWIIIIANIDYMVFQWLITLFLPFLTAIGFMIAVGVTMLVWCRPLLIINDINDTGGDTDGIATVHTADWMFHQLPFFEAVIIAFCLYKEASCALRYQVDKQITNPVLRGLFIFFACSLHAIYALIYCLIAPFDHVYMLGPPAEAAIPAVYMIVIALVAGVVVYLIFFRAMVHSPNAKDAGATLWTVAAAAKRKQIREHIAEHRNKQQTAKDGSHMHQQRANSIDTGRRYVDAVDRTAAVQH
jgi:hypothetical protein